MRGLIVTASGPLATLQDFGRPGFAHLGVPRSGAADLGALRQANRLVGNPEGAAAIETTMGGFAAVARGLVVVAVTGPATQVLVDGRPVGSHAVLGLHDGQRLQVRAPASGCRNYVAVRGGFEVEPVLGSASYDSLSDLGTPPLRAGDRLAVGRTAGTWPPVTVAPGPPPVPRRRELTARRGPRLDRLAAPAALTGTDWRVHPASNRIGVRLDPVGEAVLAHKPGLGDLASEGVPLGAVQVPPSGRPVLFLADHPVTGGYPVVAVLTAAAVDLAAQLVAGDVVRLRVT